LARGSPPIGLNLRLLVAEAAQIEPAPGGPVLEILPNRLGAEDYAHWLNRCRVILLPYDALAYRERTSGIFTEAIIAGRLPLVTEGTWMAGELERYDLGGLILDWAEPETVWLKMIEALANPRILDKLSAMRSAYRQFHTLERFAEALRGLYDSALPCQDQ
jgi:glycosyltransferase involved in cell wall biosynthesis